MNETTAILTLGPITRIMSGLGTMRAETVLVLDEGSRASWRIIELDGQMRPVCAVAQAPEHLLAHGLIAFLASRPADDFGLAGDAQLSSLACRSSNGRRLQTRTSVDTAQALANALNGRVGIVVSILPGSTLKASEVDELRCLGVRIELAA